MADPHPHTSTHSSASRRSSPAIQPEYTNPPDRNEQISAIEIHVGRIEALQNVDHAMLTQLNEAVGSSPDAATGAEGRGMRRQLAEVALGVKAVQKDMADMKVRADGGAGSAMTAATSSPRNSTAGTIGSMVAGFMATAVLILEMLKTLGLLK